jgi:DtxR family transcriptional regulator, Mn-dependent transcriptional regulator
VLLSTLQPGQKGVITGVDDHSSAFLQYLNQLGLTLGTSLEVVRRVEYDHSIQIALDDGRSIILSSKVAQHLFIKSNT